VFKRTPLLSLLSACLNAVDKLWITNRYALQLFVHTFKLVITEDGMTERQRLVFDFIKAYIKIHGMAPSYEVIAKGLNMKSRANMHRIVQKLKEDGYLEKRPRKFYGIKLLDKSVKEIASL
jgi:hypothetical protein